jgi:glycosyltransferase involved in cell wall biosynthesis
MKFSIIIPVFNRPKELARAIQSILIQSYSDFELIIIDDCSNDGTVDVALEFSKIDDRVKVYKNGTNGGACISRNNGINLSVNEYLAFLDSDDEWLPDYLMEMKKLIDLHVDYGAYYSDIGLVDNKGVIVPSPTSYGLEGDISKAIFQQMYLCTPSTLIVRREIAKKIGGFDVNFTRGCNDDEFCIKLALNTRVKYLNKILGIFHVDAIDRISTNPIGQIIGFGKLLCKFKAEIIKSNNVELLVRHYENLQKKYEEYYRK